MRDTQGLCHHGRQRKLCPGGTIKDDNLAKLNELSSAANVFAAEYFEVHPRLFHRKLPGGKTLLETIASGGSGAEAARALMNMLDIETEQRVVLDKIFASRDSSKKAGLGLPPLNDG